MSAVQRYAQMQEADVGGELWKIHRSFQVGCCLLPILSLLSSSNNVLS